MITHWHLVTIAIKDDYKVVLLGNVGNSGETWVTSKVTKLDMDSGYLLTNSGSLYHMDKGTRGEQEPSFEQLALMCTYINRGGYGAFFGVPEFF